VHEFEFEEFREELRRFFPHVSLFVQNHGPSIVFQPLERPTGAQVTVEGEEPRPAECNFFVAVCATTPLTGAPTYVHVPSAANVLRERSHHIIKLEEELETKNKWLEKTKAELHDLMEQFRIVSADLETSNRWAEQVNSELEMARERLDKINDEINSISSGYEKQIAEMEAEVASRARWALDTQAKLDKCASLLDVAENTVKERTAWAQKLDAEVEELRAKVAIMEASRWLKLGRAIGIGPGAKLK
jgi:archaellum component FlaC